MKPLAQSGSFTRSFTSPITMRSGTSSPLSMYCFASLPSGVPALIAARSMSPVEICGMPIAVDEELGLRAFAGARHAQQHYSHWLSCTPTLAFNAPMSQRVNHRAAQRRRSAGVSTPGCGAARVTTTAMR